MKRPLTLKLAAIFMLVLALVVGGFAAARQFGLMGGFLGAPGGLVMRGSGDFQGQVQILPGGELPEGLPELPEGGTTPRREIPGGQGGSFEVSPGGGMPFGPETSIGGGSGVRRSFGGPLGFLGGLQNWLNMGLGVLGLLAAFLLWKPSRWGIILAVVLGGLAILLNASSLMALPMMFRFPGLALTLLPALLMIVLGVLVIVLALLPASRAAVRAGAAVTAADADEPKERVVL